MATIVDPVNSQSTLRARTESVSDGSFKGNAPAIFVAQLYSRDILVLNAQRQVFAKITARYQASSLATNSAGDLYVANNAKENAIEVYTAPKYFLSLITLPQGAQANGVAVDARSGIFAVMSAHVRGKTEVSFYRHGDVKPCRVFTEALGGFVIDGGGAFDRAGVLYAYVSTGNGEAVASISGECAAGSAQVLTFSHPFQPNPDFTFNSDDNFVVQAQLAPNVSPIYTFRHPKNGQFGEPIATTQLPLYRGQEQGFGGLSSDGQHAFGGGYHDVAQYNYPAGGQPNWVLKGVAGAASIAAVPPLVP